MSRRRKQQHRRPAAPWRGRARPDPGRRADARPPFPPPGPGGPGTGGGPDPARGPGPDDDRRRATSILALLAAGRSPGRRAVRDALAALDPAAVQEAARPLLAGAVAEAWAHGWQPVELVWHAGRVGTAAGGDQQLATRRGAHPSDVPGELARLPPVGPGLGHRALEQGPGRVLHRVGVQGAERVADGTTAR